MNRLIAKTGLFIVSLISAPSAFSQTGNTDAKLRLPAGFTATIVAEGMSGARHIAFNKQGGLYIKLSQLKDGKGIIYLKTAMVMAPLINKQVLVITRVQAFM